MRISLCRFLSVLYLLTLLSCRSDQFQPDETLPVAKENAMRGSFPNIKVLSYNTFLLKELLVSGMTQWSQQNRAERLGAASFLKNYDVLMLRNALIILPLLSCVTNFFQAFLIRLLYWDRRKMAGIRLPVTGVSLFPEDSKTEE